MTAYLRTPIISSSPNSRRKTSTDLALAPGSPESAERSNGGVQHRRFILLPATTSKHLQCICCQIHPGADVHITCATADYSVQNVSRWWNVKMFWKEITQIIQQDFWAGEKESQTSFKHAGSAMARCHDNILKFQSRNERS